MTLKVATVNVNGLRAAFRKGMEEWLNSSAVDVVLCQEVRADENTVDVLFGQDWQVYASISELKGRAGVCIAVRKSSGWQLLNPDSAAVAVEVPQDSGRWLEADLCKDRPASVASNSAAGGNSDLENAVQDSATDPDTKVKDDISPEQRVRLVSAYLHSGEKGTEKQTLKMSYLERVDERLSYLADPAVRKELPYVLMVGDFNIVNTERDIKNWKPNHNKRAGVLDEEIAYLDRWFRKDWVDVVRTLHPDEQGPYSWWSWRGKAFDNDAGWRIDYHLASPQLAKLAKSDIVDRATSYQARWSDHAPVVVEYDL